MKQYITLDQLNELGEKAETKLIDWCKSKNYKNLDWPLPFLSIGQMIEFLYQNETVVIESEDRESPHMGWVVNRETGAVELCDALWTRVKKILEKK